MAAGDGRGLGNEDEEQEDGGGNEAKGGFLYFFSGFLQLFNDFDAFMLEN